MVQELPSVIAFKGEEISVGELAKRQAIIILIQLAQLRKMGESSYKVTIGDKKYTHKNYQHDPSKPKANS